MIKETLKILNPWWKEEKISKELAKPYKRHPFKELIKLLKYKQIIIITGLRRVGKTTLLYQLVEFLLKKVSARKIVYFNFDKTIEEITQIFEAYKNLTKVEWKKEKIYVLLDEVTKLKDWASKIKLIYDAFPNIKFILSSSSSVALESEAIKALAGRYFMLNINPLEFSEYLELKNKSKFLKQPELWEKEIKEGLKNYLTRTFPECVDWKEKARIKDFLRTTILDRIVREDLPEKFKNVNRELLFKLIEIFYSNPGMILNYDSISRKLKISKKTLVNHIYFMEFSYLIRRIRNFRPSMLASSRKLQKVYAYWWTPLFCYTENLDFIIENVIASSFDARYYWRNGSKEIDFLIVKNKSLIPVEVKNKKDILSKDLENIKYFLKEYKAKYGLLIYQGQSKKLKINKKVLKIVPLWKALLFKDGLS